MIMNFSTVQEHRSASLPEGSTDADGSERFPPGRESGPRRGDFERIDDDLRERPPLPEGGDARQRADPRPADHHPRAEQHAHWALSLFPVRRATTNTSDTQW